MARTLQHEIGKRRPFEEPAVEAYLNIARTAAALGGDVARLMREHGMTGAKYNALRILRGHGGGGVSCQTIHDEMVVPSPDVTRLVDGLESAGLAERVRVGDDRRVVTVRITQAGLDTVAALDRPLLELHKNQLAHMSRDELEQLSRLLVKAREGA